MSMSYTFATREELDAKTAYYRERYRSLALLAVGDLKDVLDQILLGEIDAFFCWGFLTYEYRYRALRMLQQVDDLRAVTPNWADDDVVAELPRRDRRAVERGRKRYAQHEEGLRRLGPLLELAFATKWNRTNVRPIGAYVCSNDEERHVVLVVYATTFRGWNIAEHLELLAHKRDLPIDPPPGDVHRVAATFALIRSTETPPPPFDPLPFAPRQLPCVVIRTPVPLPDPESVAREYDAVVRDRLGWHRLLAGTEDRDQDPAVAMRTWAVTLQMNAGIPFAEAMRRVCAAGEPVITEVSHAKFGEDRRRLLERLPEAYGMLVQPERDRSGCNP